MNQEIKRSNAQAGISGKQKINSRHKVGILQKLCALFRNARWRSSSQWWVCYCLGQRISGVIIFLSIFDIQSKRKRFFKITSLYFLVCQGIAWWPGPRTSLSMLQALRGIIFIDSESHAFFFRFSVCDRLMKWNPAPIGACITIDMNSTPLFLCKTCLTPTWCLFKRALRRAVSPA